MPLHHTMPSLERYVVAFLYGQRLVDLNMGVNDHHVSHLSGANVVNTEDARCLQKGCAYGHHLLFIDGPIHQVMKCIPSKTPSHFGYHETDEGGSDRIQDRKAK